MLLNLETKVQRLIPIGQQRVGRSGEVSNGLVHELQDHPSIDTASSKEEPTLVSIMALSNDRQFLAIGSHSARNEVADGPRDSPVIAIWDMVSLKRRKTLVVPDIGPKVLLSRAPHPCGSLELSLNLGTQTIASLSFSSDGLFLLAMTSAPDFSMYVWNWERGKLQGQLRFGQLGQDLAAAQKLDSSAHDVETFAVPVMRRRASSIVANGHPVAGPSNEGPRLSIPTKTGDALHSVSPSTDRNGSVKHANQANSIVHNASRRGSQTNGNIPKLNRRASVVANTGTVVVNEQVRVDEAIEIVQASFVPFDGEFYQICIVCAWLAILCFFTFRNMYTTNVRANRCRRAILYSVYSASRPKFPTVCVLVVKSRTNSRNLSAIVA